MFYILKFILRPFFFLLYPTRHVGRRINHKGRGIVIANHQSVMDVLIMAYSVRRKVYFMAKSSLFRSKFRNWFWRKLGAFPVNRDAPGPSTIKTALSVLNSDKLLAMYPEGTRNKTNEGELNELKKGLATFALKTHSPIIPTYIVRKPRIFRINKIIIGSAFELTELYDKKIDKDLLAEATEIITEKMEELKNQAKRKGRKSK